MAIPSGRYRFTGREFESITGFQYHRARYYDPGTGRWTSQDPLGLLADINPYRYAGNSPVNFVDRDGEVAVLATLGVIAIYVGTQALFAAAETGIEYALVQQFGSDQDIAQFSIGERFLVNFGINIATGGIGGKGKLITKIGAFVLRQSIEIGAETGYDVYKGRDVEESLIRNTIGSLAGEGIGKAIGFALKVGGRAGKRMLDQLTSGRRLTRADLDFDVDPTRGFRDGLPADPKRVLADEFRLPRNVRAELEADGIRFRGRDGHSIFYNSQTGRLWQCSICKEVQSLADVRLALTRHPKGVLGGTPGDWARSEHCHISIDV
ncbi:MAG: hypothetical protein KatS3mg105_2044 [Gemmatales bacterium]|nr:MAG: hypothetical protein KatS3mg105_2044 [Gemmatales bacterium]